MHVVLMKGKPIPEGLKMFVLSEAETGYILHAMLQHKKMTTDKEDFGANFGIVLELLEGKKLEDGNSLLDQGYCVNHMSKEFWGMFKGMFILI